jgi:hypothetical protein
MSTLPDRPSVTAPDQIVLARDLELAGRGRELWIRRGLFALVPLVSLLALLNLFGQRPTDSQASTDAATLELHAPERVRSGLLYQARFTVEAHRDVRNAVLVLDPGWFEGMTVNTIEPSPAEEKSVEGDPALELGPIAAGGSHVLYMQFQINPTNVGRRSQAVRLLDGKTPLLTLERSITVFP